MYYNVLLPTSVISHLINYILSLQVNIIDIDDSPPLFREQNYHVYVSEGEDLTVAVLLPAAVDSDTAQNSNTLYSIVSPARVGAATEFGSNDIHCDSQSVGVCDSQSVGVYIAVDVLLALLKPLASLYPK